MAVLMSSRSHIVVYVHPSSLLSSSLLDSESETFLVQMYASQILHMSVNLDLLERLRPEICHVALSSG